MSNTATNILLDVATEAYITSNAHEFAKTVLLNPGEELFLSVQQDLVDNEIDIEPLVLSYFRKPEDKPVAALFCKLLDYVANYPWEEDALVDPDSDYEAYLEVYKSAARVFSRRDRSVDWFSLAFRKIISRAMDTAHKADIHIGKNYHKTTETLANLLHTPYSLAAADKSEAGDHAEISFYIANYIFQVYFEIDNITLCRTVMNNLESLIPKLAQFPMGDQTMFHFWNGRIHLAHHRLRQALEELRIAFEMCTNEAPGTRRMLLIYAIAAGLPLGTFPNSYLLEEFDLVQQFKPLIRAIKFGNLALFKRQINRWRKWYAKRGIWLLLREKCEVLVLRSLVRRTYLIRQSQLSPEDRNPDKPPYIPIPDILTALRVSAQDFSYSQTDVENMVCNLLDQRYISGYYHHTLLTVVLNKKAHISLASSFPPPNNVQLRVQADEAVDPPPVVLLD